MQSVAGFKPVEGWGKLPPGATDSRGDVYVAEVSYTVKGRHENPPREIRSLQKFARKG